MGVADAGFEQAGIFQARLRNFVALNIDDDRFVPADAAERDSDDGAFGALEHVSDLRAIKASARLSVHRGDDVARLDARAVSRCTDHRRKNNRVVSSGAMRMPTP